ncbi:hypothetical protein G7Y89_g1936 [Cudoniella acicularis]|uniref:Expansin-like EG45 domain-containing protein n=1 Tax=Cudoniella acicularis TaxID=354080 RepID=A0A8H4RU87_9HELO|nr:hypothetical protein G7Y89_g1936 [Cudoniella acicularis]
MTEGQQSATVVVSDHWLYCKNLQPLGEEYVVNASGLANQLDIVTAFAVPRDSCGIACYSCVLMTDYYSQCQPNQAGSTTASWTDPMLGSNCNTFCTGYPVLCKDPTGSTLRGNFATPNRDYYTQFWPSLPGDLDNYLSCGECMELIRTKADGTDYAIGEADYTDPIVLEVLGSCLCSANSKWCCGPGADHCGEINFKYGCPLPSGSIHLDLSDIAMGRLQGDGSMANGVIPTQYKRIPCLTPGNVYIWLRDGGGPYYFALSVVNTAGVGSVTNVEIQGYGTNGWTSMIHDPNYSESRPQERYGSWVMPKGAGPSALPIAVRVTKSDW